MFESDTDDTSSSVSTIIERIPRRENSFTSVQTVASLSSGIFNSFEREFNAEDNLRTLTSITEPAFSFNKSEILIEKENSGSDVQLEKQSTTTATTSTEETSVCLSNNITPVDVTLGKDEQSGSGESNEEIQNEPAIELAEIKNTADERSDQADEKIKINEKEHAKEEDEEDEEDEDFEVITNDIISRVDDDKDDFMLDTDYLNETSSRYLYHHTGSELTLTHYGELTSITEEDEEDELNLDNNDKTTDVLLKDELHTLEDTFQTAVRNEILPEEAINDLKQTKTTTVNQTIEKQQNDDESIEEDNYNANNNLETSKVSLNSVCDFLNQANDDFEFVERMLELTNDKIGSIDDIMRIRESIRDIQGSQQNDRLERILDSREVIDELMAMSASSSSSSSSASSSSLDNECHSPFKISKFENGKGKVSNNNDKLMTKSLDMSAEDDLAASFFDQTLSRKRPKINRTIEKKETPSRIPKPVTITPQVPKTLNKKFSSVSNIYNRSNLELRPSLIPRPISNFNLSAPSKETPSYKSHNCLNRSNSMQSIPQPHTSAHLSCSSLPRPTKTTTLSRRVTNGTIGTYHQNCLSTSTPNSVLNYGSLSRNISKSSTNVYNSGSLPRPSRLAVANKNVASYNGQNNNANNNSRTSSLMDLSHGKLMIT